MRILFLASAVSIHTIRWVNSIAKKGHEVHLVFKKDDCSTLNEISERVILHKLNVPATVGYYLNALQLRKLAKVIKPDIINVHYASGYGTTARIAGLTNIAPLVLSVWGSDVYEFPYQSKLKNRILIKNLMYADAIASTSRSMADQVRLLLENPKMNIYITPFGVDLSFFTRKKVKKSNKIIISNLKSLKEVYGFDHLIRAIRILKDNLLSENNNEISEKIIVKIYGDGILFGNLKSLTCSLKLDDTIFFMGAIPHKFIPDLLNEVDIFCATSNKESFGVSLIEAMAMEVPIVATNISGFIEVMENNKTGILVEAGNADKIADALKKMVLDEKLREEFGKNGRARVESLYNWDDNVNTMIDMYNNIIHK